MTFNTIKEYNDLKDEIATWKIFIEIMEDEYFTIKSELNRIIGKKKINEDILKVLELLQTTILENEKRLFQYKKSLLNHYEKLNKKPEKDNLSNPTILNNHHLLHEDEEHIKQNLVELKKSFSDFINLMNGRKLV